MVKHIKQHDKNLIVNLDDDEGSHSSHALLIGGLDSFFLW